MEEKEIFKKIELYYNSILKYQNNYYLLKTTINNFYYYLKSIQKAFLNPLINQELITKINNLISVIPYRPIVNLNIKLNNNYSNILDQIVYEIRLNILKKYPNVNDINYLDMTNLCAKVSNDIIKLSKKYQLSSYYICIEPGYDYLSKIYNGNGFHYFVVILYQNDYYLVDLTYSQFFNLKNNLLSRLGIIGSPNPQAGIFMIIDDERLNLAKELLSKGYILLTRRNLKLYLDGFTMANRNGLYYEKYGEKAYYTNYDYEDYIGFLDKNNQDSQVLREGREVLGVQKRLLQNHKLKF